MSTPLSAPRLRSTHAGALPRGFLVHHLAWPLAAAVLASAALMHGGGDHWLADAVFQLEGGHWALRDHWLTSGVIHRGGKWLSALAAMAVLGLYLHASRDRQWASLRQPLFYLLLAAALGSASVSLLKSVTHVDCPWDLAGYGGTRMPTGLFASHAAGAPRGGCYPAGHASAGYAWVSLYFAALLGRPHWRWWGLGIGIGAGLLFGISQQLRGAHFLSHDIAALSVCWLVALALFVVLRSRASRTTASGGAA